MFSRPSFMSSTIESQASTARAASRSRASPPLIRREKEETVAAIARLRSVVAHVLENGIERHSSLLFGVPVLGRQNHEPKAAIIGHVGVRCEDVRAVEEWNIAGEFLQHFGDLAAHFVSVVEAALAILHLAAQVGARVEPEARGVLRPCRRSC